MHGEYLGVVQEAWRKGGQDVTSCLAEVRNDSISFNKDNFGNIFKRKRRVEARINGVQKSLESWDDSTLEALERQLQVEYEHILLRKK